jgi:hypothetical protein
VVVVTLYCIGCAFSFSGEVRLLRSVLPRGGFTPLPGSADAFPLGRVTQRAIESHHSRPKQRDASSHCYGQRRKVMNSIIIRHVNTAAEAEALVAEGFCPVECSMGKSVVDALQMDHHGELSNLEGVAVRAYRDNFGARKADPRFVVTGFADADATFAIAALCGLLPHPSREAKLASAPPPVKTSGTKDLTVLAALVNRVDTAPIGIRLESEPFGDTLLLWNQLGGTGNDALAFYAGVDRWRTLTAGRPLVALLTASKTEEANRVTKAREAKVEKVSETVAVVESDAWGFDVWYAEVCPVVVAFVEKSGNITIGCPDTTTAEKFFGAGGLKNVFPKLGQNCLVLI